MSPGPVRRILLATDFSDTAERAAAVARDYARAFGAGLHILHVAWAGDEQASRLLIGVGKDLGSDVEVTTAIEFGSPAARIVDYARRHGVDLIVVGTHGRTGVSRALLGSVAERVVRTAPCPVLTVPQSAPASAAPEVSAPELRRCLVCAAPSDDLICETCRARIRGEALDRKQRDERAGRP
jgi:universal stress protein A